MVAGSSAARIKQAFHLVPLHKRPCFSFVCSGSQSREVSGFLRAIRHSKNNGILPKIYGVCTNSNNSKNSLSYRAMPGRWIISHWPIGSDWLECSSERRSLSSSSMAQFGLKDMPPKIRSKLSSTPRKAKLRRMIKRGFNVNSFKSLLKKKTSRSALSAGARRLMPKSRDVTSRRGFSDRSEGIRTRRQSGDFETENSNYTKHAEEDMERHIGKKGGGFGQKYLSRRQVSVTGLSGKKALINAHKTRAHYERLKASRDKKVHTGNRDRLQYDVKLQDAKQHPLGLKDDADKLRIKRVMRLDPRDQSRKRIDETHQLQEKPGSAERQGFQKSGSTNALFRAIQPSEQLLDHIEKLMLGRRRLVEWRKAGYNIKLKAPLDDTPFGSADERQPITDKVFGHKLKFVAAAKQASSLPAVTLPEVAVAGRSNVGKSSLINALTRQWGVARTSEKPGLTQTINFFNLGGKLCLVDLPGYGFAYAKEEAKEAWEGFVKDFVLTRKGLKRVCLLVDAKWGLKPRDEELISLMERAQTKYQVVLTKTDALSPMDLARRATQVQEALKSNKSLVHPVMMVSSKTGGGVPAFRKSLGNLVS